MLTIRQFAAKIGKSRQRVHQLLREGRINPPPKKVGYYYLIQEGAKVSRVNDK